MDTPTFTEIAGSRAFLDELQEGIWIADGHGGIVFANRSLASILGHSGPDALVGKTWKELYPPTEAARIGRTKPHGETRTITDSVVLGRDNQAIPASVSVARKDLENKTWYLGTVIPLASKTGPSSVLADYTSRQIMESAVDGICIVEQGKVVYVNRRFEELTGFSSNQLSGTGLERIVAPKDRKTISQVVSEPQRVLTPVHHEVRFTTRSGQELDCELRIVPTESSSGTALLCFLRDISQLRRAEQVRTDFIAMVSHELRTPLAAIREAMSLLSETAASQLHERQRRYLGIAREEIDRLNRMIDNLIEVSRMESGKTSLKLEAVGLDDVLSKSLESLSMFISKKGLKVQKQLPARLPPLLADRDRVLQVFNNILDNSIKYSPDNGAIQVSAHFVDPKAPVLAEENVLPNTGYVQVTIADSGPGIPAEFLDRVFGKFERVDPHGPGIGLGLAIVRSIVELHHGKVWARSTLGEGTSFDLILPIRDNHG